MISRHSLALAPLLLIAACGTAHSGADASTDGASTCGDSPPSCWSETSPGTTCCTDTFAPATCESGRWACALGSRFESECESFAPMCEGPTDAGTPPPMDSGTDSGISPDPADAGPVACGETAGPYQCLRMGCVPYYDNGCCPSCGSDSMCADCSDYTITRCRPFRDACATWCDLPAPWACSDVPPECSSASVTNPNSCDVPGCVPAYPSSVGTPNPDDAVCVPVHRDVCRTQCRRSEPPCPDGMVPEGDGSCYTDRCIPAFVCS